MNTLALFAGLCALWSVIATYAWVRIWFKLGDERVANNARVARASKTGADAYRAACRIQNEIAQLIRERV